MPYLVLENNIWLCLHSHCHAMLQPACNTASQRMRAMCDVIDWFLHTTAIERCLRTVPLLMIPAQPCGQGTAVMYQQPLPSTTQIGVLTLNSVTFMLCKPHQVMPLWCQNLKRQLGVVRLISWFVAAMFQNIVAFLIHCFMLLLSVVSYKKTLPETDANYYLYCKRQLSQLKSKHCQVYFTAGTALLIPYGLTQSGALCICKSAPVAIQQFSIYVGKHCKTQRGMVKHIK